MSLRLYNTLTRAIEPFVPLEPGGVRMYVCGPTVYDDPHIGHARSAFIFDLLRRWLEYRKFAVCFVRNVTDVDDKIIEKARQELATSDQRPATSDARQKCREVAERYLKSYHDTLERLGIGAPDREPRATEHVVPEMTDLIAKLLMQGVAYEAGGDVYFAVRKFPGYGALSRRSLDEMRSGARIEPGEGKQDPLDFALWKSAKPGEPSWKSPWGEGRPGWHIECSAMSTKYLGDEFDIHGGGVDLVFPHHDNEVAQAQAAGKKFAHVWIHNGLLTVNGEKMSKSLGNFITVDQALEECGGNPDILKIFFLSGHYRTPLNYMKARITAYRQRYENYRNVMDMPKDLESMGLISRPEVEKLTIAEPEKLKKLKREFSDALDDDLNTPQALSALDGMRRFGGELHDSILNQTQGSDQERREEAARLLAVTGALKDHANILGLQLTKETNLSKQTREVLTDAVPQVDAEALKEARVKELKDAREEYRRQKKFADADRCRQEIEELGYTIEDRPGWSHLRPKR
ncbi:MAG: cysteine--tRNA ligase [Candidatus Omnitrophica bacterium]|nr:cysteine--tRNA ligase [Candidatus Omnitrophota bacterium]